MSLQDSDAPLTPEQATELQAKFDAKLKELQAMVAEMKRENARMQEAHKEIVSLRAKPVRLLRPRD